MPADESSVDIVVPANLNPSTTTFPPLELSVRSAVDGDSIDDPTMDRSPTHIVPNDIVPEPSVCKTCPGEPSEVGNVYPPTSKAVLFNN